LVGSNILFNLAIMKILPEDAVIVVSRRGMFASSGPERLNSEISQTSS
jgi:hypothetical protein